MVASLLFLAELGLPMWETKAAVTSTHRPVTNTRHGRTSYSTDNVVIVTNRGMLKVPIIGLNGVWPGDSVTLHRTLLLHIPKKIYLHRQELLVSSGNLIYRWFIFLPVVTLILSVITIGLKNEEAVQNIGSGSIILGLFILSLLLRDYLN